MSPTVGRALRTINLIPPLQSHALLRTFALTSVPRAQVVSDGSVMTAANRLGTQITVCRDGCVIVQINDRRPLARDTDLTPTAAQAFGSNHRGNVGRYSMKPRPGRPGLNGQKAGAAIRRALKKAFAIR